MERGETYQKSRADRIKEARESCNHSGISHNYQEKELHTRPVKERPLFNQEEPAAAAIKKGTLVRLFIASFLFLAILAWDQLQFKIGSLNSNVVEEMVRDNKFMNEMKKDTADYIEEKIIPVFNRLKD